MRGFIGFIANNFGFVFEGGAEVFLWFFNRAIAASWLIIAVILLRFILKKAPKWFSCALWGICALRLVLPFSLQSVLSLIPSAETVPPETIYDSRPQIDSGIPVIDNNINAQITEQYYEGVTVAQGATLSFTSFIAFIWILGVLALLIYAVVSFVKLKKSVKGANELEKSVFESAAVSSPFILGIFRPRIYLPLNMDEETKQYVLGHERAHLKRADHILKPLSFVILALYWFSPLVWVAYMLFCRDIELACDEKVIKELSDENRADYAQALLSCAANQRIFSACPLAFGEVSVKDRIKSALSYKKPMLWIIIAGLICAIAVSVFFLTDPISKKTLALSVTGYNSEYAGVSLSLSAVDINSEKPYITVNWHNNTDGEFTYGESFSLKRYENDKWVSCVDGELIFHDIAYVLMPNSGGEHTYYLSGFDISKAGKYRFETGFSNEFRIDFTLTETKEPVDGFAALNDGSEIIDINYGGEEGEKLFESLSENSDRLSEKNHLPIIYIETKKELSEISNKMVEHFSLEREYNEAIEKYDEDFFEQSDLLMIYVWEGSGSVRHEVTGLKKDQNDVLTVTVNRLVPEIGTADMAGYAVLVPVNKQTAKDCSFDAISTETNLTAPASSEVSKDETSSSSNASDNSSVASKDETSSSNSSSEASSDNNISSSVSSTVQTEKLPIVNFNLLDRINSSVVGDAGSYGSATPGLEKVSADIGRINIFAEHPVINIYWYNRSESTVSFNAEYSVKYYENGRWVNCSKDGKLTFTDEIVAEPSGYKSVKREFAIDGYDFSKYGKYRVEISYGITEYYEFTIAKKPNFNSIPFTSELYDAGEKYGGNFVESTFDYYQYSTGLYGKIYYYKIDSRSELVDFLEKSKPHLNSMGYNDRYNLSDMLKKYDDEFFQNNTMFLVYLRTGVSSMNKQIAGVQKQNGTLKVTIYDYPEGNAMAIDSSIFTISLDKSYSKGIKKLEFSFYEMNFETIYR